MNRVGGIRTWALLIGVWSVIGLLLARVHLRWHDWAGMPISPGQAAVRGFGDAYLWLFVTALAIVVTRRYPLEPRRWRQALAVHAAIGVVVPIGRFGAYLSILGAAGGLQRGYLGGAYFLEIYGPYLVILGVVQAFHYAQRVRERQIAAQRLQAELVTARLHRLKSQLHPHFLFNTLHAISSLMHSDVRAADRMLSQLADLLRSSLRAFDAQKVTLRDEMDFLVPYLEIERARLRERLRVELDVDRRLDLALVPHLLLQPLVENAVRHGIASRATGGVVHLRVTASDKRVCIEVADDGPGASEAALGAAQGIGLANTRQRLAALYGDDHRMEIETGPEGFTVRIELPLELAPETAAARGAPSGGERSVA